jgi:membrane associated rhomboid family serine protease
MVMTECSECGKQTMAFTCHYCGEKFCSEHRLPEKHDCDGLESGKMDEYTSEEKEEENEKWFKDRDLKSESREPVSTPSLWQDILGTVQDNATYSIIGVTVFFFLVQGFLPGASPPFTQAGFQAVLENPFSLNPLTLFPALEYVALRPWTLLTVMLMHGGLFHLMANMVTFYFFGSTLEKVMGKKELLKFYLTTGIVSSIGFVLFSNLQNLLTAGSTLSPAVGASGAVVAAVGAVAVLYPEAEVLLYFIIPMKIRTAVYAFGILETVNLVFKLGGIYLPVIGGFASSAHLTGLVAGVLLARRYRDRVRRTRTLDLFR